MTTCADYRGGLVLAALHKQLSDEQLDPKQREEIETEVERLEAELNLD